MLFLFCIWRKSLGSSQLPKITNTVKVRLTCLHLPFSSTIPPSAWDRTKPHCSSDYPNVVVFSETLFAHILKTWHAVTFFAVTVSANAWHSKLIWVYGPPLHAWAVPISELYALTESAGPKAIPSTRHTSSSHGLLCSRSLTFLPTFVFPGPYPRALPLSWLHLPLVHLLILTALFLSLACFFEDQCLSSS